MCPAALGPGSRGCLELALLYVGAEREGEQDCYLHPAEDPEEAPVLHPPCLSPATPVAGLSAPHYSWRPQDGRLGLDDRERGDTILGVLKTGGWVLTTENVAILFTDVVGSTELSQGLSVEAADEVRRAHFSILRRAIAETGGTEVKNLGDGLMVVFPLASAAIDCAVAMQQGVERGNRHSQRPLGLRVGLSVGEATREADDYFGDPVIEAARLCAACEGGQALATDFLRAVAGRRIRHQCRPAGELTLKGLPHPVEAVEVLWEPLAATESAVTPLPSRLAVRPAVGVVGRELELQAIADAAKRVGGNQGREVLLVSGEAGLGKTTLVAEAARTAYDGGAVVLFGHCEEDLATPYQLFAEALRHYVTNARDIDLAAHVDALGSELVGLVPALQRRLPDLPPPKATDSDSERFLLFAAVVGLLAQISEQQPVVLVFDDLQWADTGSLLLLRHLQASEQALRVLVLGTYRDTELSQAHALVETLGLLRRSSGVSRIELTGLNDTEVLTFMEAAAGQKLDVTGVGLAHAVYRETDGNPFFVEEMLRHLSETGAIYQDARGRWVANDSLEQMALPDSVREVIGARVVRLGEGAQRVLSMAAVIGRDFDLDLVVRVTGRTEDEVLDVLDAASAVALVRELSDTTGRYSFAHSLIQHTLYQDLGATRRALAHRQVAEALEALLEGHPQDRAEELAHHYLAATRPVDTDKAVIYARQAGERALKALAPGDAVRYFSQALELTPDRVGSHPPQRIDLLIDLGTAQRQAGIPLFRETLFDAARQAREVGDADCLVRAALANNRGWFSSLGQVDQERVEILEAALTALPGADSPQRTLLLATLCSELSYSSSSLDRRLELAAEAKAMAERSNDPVARLQTLTLCDVATQIPSLNAKRLAETIEGLELAEELDDPLQLFLIATVADKPAMQAGQFELGHRCLTILKKTSDRLHQPTAMWIAAYREASYAQVAGDPVRAEELAAQALELGTESGQPDAFSIYGTQIIGIRRQQGRLAEMVPLVQDVVNENPGVPSYQGALALAHLEAENETMARQILESAAVDGFSLPLDAAWIDGIVANAWIAIQLQARSQAERLFDLLAPYSDQIPFDGVIPLEPIAMFLGGLAWVLGRDEQAEVYLSEALALARRGGMKYARAQTELLWGTMLTAHEGHDRMARAPKLLDRASAAAISHGYGAIERRATAVLAEIA
jgi:class 3 adenylate cyclase